MRRAFLCGDAYDQRRQWIEQRLAELLDVFAIEACAYAIMPNHLHLILKTDPTAATKALLERVRAQLGSQYA